MVHDLPSWRSLETSPWPPGADDDAVARLLDLAEEAAPEVAAHMERTARLARRFATELELAQPLLELVVRTAHLHDIGKLAIPPWVHEKPGPLTDTERQMMRAHPVMGQRILERKPVLIALGPLVRATHERWDGNGYPDRLKGPAIPLPSRIVAVCDAWDAMTNTRVYRGPLSRARAREELSRGAGTQFDPGIVGPFRALLDEQIDCWAIGA
ncbi:MAG TPA: HD domain-containing phosphohydrolase [Thermoleophilaceae bacterium]|nr:HD domain-containing phosphohydrolase [Thermoleophilaceae bacterium]